MRPILVSLVAAVAALPALAGPAPAATPRPVIGIADNKPDMFADARFAALGVRHVRVAVPWDILTDRSRLPALDAWMAGAKRTGTRPLVTFESSRQRRNADPRPARLAATLRALRRRYPGQVREVATWNEPNFGKRPKVVAAWWLALRRACPTCKVLAAELVDLPNAARYARAVARAAKRTPRLWGLHNYLDVNRFSTKGTAAVLRATKGELWLTETGGVDHRNNGSRVRFRGEGPAHAAKAMRWLFGKVAALSPRIRRVYVYHWSASAAGDAATWDSALVDAAGERPALGVLRDAIAGRIRPAPPRGRGR